jgi:hypothetical protein
MPQQPGRVYCGKNHLLRFRAISQQVGIPNEPSVGNTNHKTGQDRCLALLSGNHNMRILKDIFRATKQLAMSWYDVDRIRIAPTTGRLLLLKAGDSLLLLNELYTVQKRIVESNNSNNRLTYQLTFSGGKRQMIVMRDSDRDPAIGEISIDDRTVAVFDSDICLVHPESLSTTPGSLNGLTIP